MKIKTSSSTVDANIIVSTKTIYNSSYIGSVSEHNKITTIRMTVVK